MELFAEFDWNQVLMKGLIGGVIGLFVGLAMLIFKKKEPPKEPKTMLDEDPPFENEDEQDPPRRAHR